MKDKKCFIQSKEDIVSQDRKPILSLRTQCQVINETKNKKKSKSS